MGAKSGQSAGLFECRGKSQFHFVSFEQTHLILVVAEEARRACHNKLGILVVVKVVPDKKRKTRRVVKLETSKQYKTRFFKIGTLKPRAAPPDLKFETSELALQMPLVKFDTLRRYRTKFVKFASLSQRVLTSLRPRHCVKCFQVAWTTIWQIWDMTQDLTNVNFWNTIWTFGLLNTAQWRFAKFASLTLQIKCFHKFLTPKTNKIRLVKIATLNTKQ